MYEINFKDKLLGINETFETEITGQSTVIGTQSNTGGMGFGRGQRMQ